MDEAAPVTPEEKAIAKRAIEIVQYAIDHGYAGEEDALTALYAMQKEWPEAVEGE